MTEGASGGIAFGGKTLALGLPSTLALWSVVDAKVQVRIAPSRQQSVSSLAFSPSGELAMAAREGEVRLWTTGRCPTTARPLEAARGAGALTFDAEGRLLVQGRDELLWLAEDGRTLADAPLPRPTMRGQRVGNPSSRPPNPWSGRIARSADGRTIAMTRGSEVLLGRLKADGSPGPFIQPRGLNPRLESSESPEPAGPDRLHGPPPPDSPSPGARSGRGDMGGRGAWRDLALSPDGRRLFLSSPEEISVWAVDEDRVARLPWSSPVRPIRMALAPDGRELAVLDPSGAVLLVDAGDGHLLRRLEATDEGAGGLAGALAFSPDGRELAVGSRDQIRIWSLAGPEPRVLFRLPGEHEPITALAYDSRGRYLASGGFVTGAVRVWDLDLARDKLAGLGLD